MGETGETWRQAAEAVALEVNEERCDSVVRNLGRWRKRGQRPRDSTAEAATVGFAAALKRVSLVLKSAKMELGGQSRVNRDLRLENEKRLRVIREALMTRLEFLDGLDEDGVPVDPFVEHLESGYAGMFSGRFLLKDERQHIHDLLDEAQALEQQIESYFRRHGR